MPNGTTGEGAEGRMAVRDIKDCREHGYKGSYTPTPVHLGRGNCVELRVVWRARDLALVLGGVVWWKKNLLSLV